MLSQRAKLLKPSPTLALAAKAKELSAQGHDVISLSVGEPDWDTFKCAKMAGIEAIESGFSKYTPSNGILELRKAIATQTEKETGQKYTPEEVTVTTGGKFVIYAALQCVIDPGDEVVVAAPFWVSYPVIAELAGGKAVIATCDESVNFKLTPEILEKVITNRTKVIILNSPSNPTGLMYSQEELAALAKVLLKHPKILILSDDIYNRLVFSGAIAPHILQVAPELKPRTLVVNGASKAFSMTGWRMGWALGPLEWIKAMNNYQSQSVSQAASMAQKATLAALEKGEPELREALIELKLRKDRVVKWLSDVPGLTLPNPDGAFYVWPNIKSYLNKKHRDKVILNSSDFSAALLEEQKVAVVPGNEFGLDGYIRVSFALKEERMQEAIQRIKNFVGSLQ